MKKFIAKYLLYIYLNFIIDEDKNIYKPWAIPIVNCIIFVRSIFYWILSLVFFPLFYIGMVVDNKKEKIRKELKKNKMYF